jgi:transposase
MDKKQQSQIIYDHSVNGLTYRSLGKKYGISHSRIYRMIKKRTKKKAGQAEAEVKADNLPDEVKALKEKLRKAELKIELQDLIIDISSKELGVDLRKKHGTRQS